MKGLSCLRELDVSGTRVSAFGIQWLGKALPKAVISAWPRR